MAICNFLSLPILSAALLRLLILSQPTSSLGLSPRRSWAPLWAADGTKDGGSSESDATKGRQNTPTASSQPASSFERTIRRLTGNEEYKFGDISKRVVNSTTTSVEGAVRTVTGDEEYQFGDFTKKAVGSTTQSFEGVVRTMTGNEGYQFGDLTRGAVRKADGVLTYSEKTLKLIRDNNIHELVELLNLYWMKSMNYEERKEAFVVLVYLAAILVLSYNFVANAMSGMVFAAAWAKTSVVTGTSPLSPDAWAKFLGTKATLEMLFGGPFLPVRAVITIPWFFEYRKFVVATAHNSPLREKFPVVNRCISLLLSYVVANLAFVGGLTFAVVRLLSLWTGVPVFPSPS